MPLNLEELSSDSNAVIERMSRWFDMFDEIRAIDLEPKEK